MDRRIMSTKANYNVDTVLMDLLLKYGDDVIDVMVDAITDVSKEAKKQVQSNIKATFKKGRGRKHYMSGWRVQLKRTRLGMESVVYANSSTGKPSLTHLLENGHAISGGTGRVAGKPHIAPVNEWAQEEVMNRIEEGIMKL